MKNVINRIEDWSMAATKAFNDDLIPNLEFAEERLYAAKEILIALANDYPDNHEIRSALDWADSRWMSAHILINLCR